MAVKAAMIALLGLALVGLGGVGLLTPQIAAQARGIPDLPTHARINRLNILLLRDRWTPEIRALHTWAVRFMLLFIGSAVLYLGVAIGSSLRE